ncbi:MAG: M1 family metallopeptidase [Salinimicrobium sp.]
MNTKSAIAGALLLLMSAAGFSQELYRPRDIKEAYANKTRSQTGEPGANYWQNKGTYDIELIINPPDRMVRGSEKITYINNSPDTLRSVNFKLILNNHKPGAARLGQTSEERFTDGIIIDKYVENGVEKEWKDKNDGTNKSMELSKPLPPHDSLKLNIDWHFELVEQSGREGAIDSTTFFLAYFYPRVAVYDDYSGWDRMTFTGSQEFYNDFNDYNLSVTVPEDYVVWSTGDLQNPEEVLQQKYLELLRKSMTSDEVITIASLEDLENKEITKDGPNTWKWTAKNITDVALAVSDHYLWDAASVVVDPVTGRRASVQAAYDEPSKDFQKMVSYGQHALEWFSNNYPGVPYPFSKSTIVRGFADMEYPMMVNDSSTPDDDFTRFVAEHEIAHTYFPFYMGINETRFGFMDEGWATALEYLISINDLGEEQATQNFQNFRVKYWINDSSMEEDIPIITPTNILSGRAMGNNEYGKAALGYLALKDLLGEEMFKKALQGYMDRWNGKHPVPWDFFYSFNDISGRDLNWFWDSWFFSNNYIDLAITDVQKNGKNALVKLKNIGGMPAPVDLVITAEDGSVTKKHLSPEVWKNNLKQTSVKIEYSKPIKSIELEGGIFMDADTSNNSWN